MLTASPYKVSIPAGVTSDNLTINALFSQNGSASGGLQRITSNLSFVSSNPAIATVSSGGQITGVSGGAANVTVSYSYRGETKTVVVPVTITMPAT